MNAQSNAVSDHRKVSLCTFIFRSLCLSSVEITSFLSVQITTSSVAKVNPSLNVPSTPDYREGKLQRRKRSWRFRNVLQADRRAPCDRAYCSAADVFSTLLKQKTRCVRNFLPVQNVRFTRMYTISSSKLKRATSPNARIHAQRKDTVTRQERKRQEKLRVT